MIRTCQTKIVMARSSPSEFWINSDDGANGSAFNRKS